MVKSLIAIFFIVAISVGQPRIVVTETHFDLGKLFKGSSVAHSQFIHNTGDQPLRIDQLDAPCNCSSPSISSDLIAPNDSAELTILFNSSAFLGVVHKGIIVVTNDPEQRNVFVEFDADILPVLQVQPEELSFRNNGDVPGATQTLKLKNSWIRDITILSVDEKNNVLKTSPDKFIIHAGDSVTVSVSVSGAAVNGIHGGIELTTTCDFLPILRIPYEIEAKN